MTFAPLCSIDDCSNSHLAKGLCNKHYKRLRRNCADLAFKGTDRGEALEYFQTVVLQYAGDECLTWPYARIDKGYGVIRIDGKMHVVSRLACEHANGPPPTPEHEAAHSCGQGHIGCVSKLHMRWATKKENQADRIIHGTNKRAVNVVAMQTGAI